MTHPVVDTHNLNADAFAILLAHARWADAHLLDHAAKLTDPQLDQPFDIGLQTLRATITHNIGAMRSWADVYAQRPQRPWIGDEGPFTPDELRAMHDETHDDWADLAARLPLDTIVERPPRRFTRAHILAHVTTHSIHHRAQAFNILRHLGVGSVSDPLPPLSVTGWAQTLPL
jgi:uncharacterized damage-inducible protein DinB